MMNNFTFRLKRALPLLILYSIVVFYISINRIYYSDLERIIIFLLPFAFTFLFGTFDGWQTGRKDNPSSLKDWKHDQQQYSLLLNDYQDPEFREDVLNKENRFFDEFDLFFVGNNRFYPPGNIFKCDYWHYHKFLWISCIPGIAISGALSVFIGNSLLWHLLYLLLFNVEGTTFVWYYWWLTRKDVTWDDFFQQYFLGKRTYL